MRWADNSRDVVDTQENSGSGLKTNGRPTEGRPVPDGYPIVVRWSSDDYLLPVSGLSTTGRSSDGDQFSIGFSARLVGNVVYKIPAAGREQGPESNDSARWRTFLLLMNVRSLCQSDPQSNPPYLGQIRGICLLNR